MADLSGFLKGLAGGLTTQIPEIARGIQRRQVREEAERIRKEEEVRREKELAEQRAFRETEAEKGRQFQEKIARQQREFRAGQRALQTVVNNKQRVLTFARDPRSGRIREDIIRKLAPVFGLDPQKDFAMEIEATNLMESATAVPAEAAERPAIETGRGPIQGIFDVVFGGKTPRTQMEKFQELSQRVQRPGISEVLPTIIQFAVGEEPRAERRKKLEKEFEKLSPEQKQRISQDILSGRIEGDQNIINRLFNFLGIR